MPLVFVFGTVLCSVVVPGPRAKRWPRKVAGVARKDCANQCCGAGGRRSPRSSVEATQRVTHLVSTTLIRIAGLFFTERMHNNTRKSISPPQFRRGLIISFGGVVLRGFERGFPPLEQTLVIFRSEGRHTLSPHNCWILASLRKLPRPRVYEPNICLDLHAHVTSTKMNSD